MSGIGIGPSVMINRLVHEAAAPGNHLLQVARLRAELATEVKAEQQEAQRLNPDAQPAPVVTGADVVDKLV